MNIYWHPDEREDIDNNNQYDKKCIYIYIHPYLNHDNNIIKNIKNNNIILFIHRYHGIFVYNVNNYVLINNVNNNNNMWINKDT